MLLSRREALWTMLLAPAWFRVRGNARLKARPGIPTRTIQPGIHALGLSPGRDGVLVVPASYRADRPMPLLLALHGATGNARGPVNLLLAEAQSRGFLVLSVDSREGTWDAIRTAFGPDVSFIDRALQFTFERCAVDPERIAVEGFSDGASYALGLGLPNGDFFRRILAFSPGMIPASDNPDQGSPPIFLSHGSRDQVLPIERTSRILSAGLKRDGFDVTFAEFDGPHTVPPEILARALDWWLRPGN